MSLEIITPRSCPLITFGIDTSVVQKVFRVHSRACKFTAEHASLQQSMQVHSRACKFAKILTRQLFEMLK